jgi:hypothetical protein
LNRIPTTLSLSVRIQTDIAPKICTTDPFQGLE